MPTSTHLGLGGLLVERKGSVNFSRDTSGNDSENLLSELYELCQGKIKQSAKCTSLCENSKVD